MWALAMAMASEMALDERSDNFVRFEIIMQMLARSLTCLFPAVLILFLLICGAGFAEKKIQKNDGKPLRALLVTGGGYHDYKKQKTILTEGISKRANVEWDIFIGDAAKTKAKLSEDGWADDYDVIVYNLCHAHETDGNFVEALSKVHREGKAAVALHCSMHSYHWKVPGETKHWPAMLGVTSPRHGKHAPIEVTNLAKDHAVMKGFPKKWTTPKGELYHIDKTWPSATVLAKGSIDGGKKFHDCVWVNTYGKGRVFGTTLGHHNETMSEDNYLGLVTRGLLWATGNLE